MQSSTILCPLDFSDSSNAALDIAVTAATALGSRLALLHVDPPPRFPKEVMSSEAYRRLREEHAQWLNGKLETARMRLCDESVEAIARLASGEPADHIMDTAREVNASLIVMSTHSTRLRRALLGSVAEKVAHRATCPVLLVRDGAYAKVPFQRVLACVDFSPATDAVLEQAGAMTADDGTIELMHVVNAPAIAALQISLGVRGEVLSLIDAVHREASENLEQCAAKLPLGEKSPVQTLLGGSVASTILNHAHESGATAIVLGTHQPQGAIERALGTVADRVLHHAEVPVLLCPSH